MAHSDLIDSLIATYRNLNMAVRPLSDSEASQAGPGGSSLRDLIAELRDHEMAASQQLKLMTIGEGGLTGKMPEILPIAEGLSTRAILSEFGTAREAILALVREMSDDEWNAEHEGPNGRTTILAFVQQLAENDKRMVGQIEARLPARAS